MFERPFLMVLKFQCSSQHILNVMKLYAKELNLSRYYSFWAKKNRITKNQTNISLESGMVRSFHLFETIFFNDNNNNNNYNSMCIEK